MNITDILKILKGKSQQIMEEDKYFHDFAHVIRVYQNAEKLLEVEQGDKLVILTAALFHDIKREMNNHGTEGAKFAKQILADIPQFPAELIEPVSKVIYAHDKDTQENQDEKILFDADKMDAFNELGTIRSFMMYSKKGFTLKEACERYFEIVDTFYDRLNTKTAKTIAYKNYKETKEFVSKLIDCYKYERFI